MTNRRTLKLTF